MLGRVISLPIDHAEMRKAKKRIKTAKLAATSFTIVYAVLVLGDWILATYGSISIHEAAMDNLAALIILAANWIYYKFAKLQPLIIALKPWRDCEIVPSGEDDASEEEIANFEEFVRGEVESHIQVLKETESKATTLALINVAGLIAWLIVFIVRLVIF